MNNKYMEEAIKMSKKAYKNDDVPVGAVIIENNKIISKSYNKKEKQHNVINHAEIIAIEKACKKKKTTYLNDCEMYVTLEPCMMCTGAIIQSHIKKVYYSCENPKFGYLLKNNTVETIKLNEYENEISELLKNFFKMHRN